MASSIQLLRSTIAQERPFPGNLLEGQPAVNLNSTEPGLFFKAADGSLVKFGPAAITSDGSPPNSSPQGSSGNTVGELWLDKSTDPAVLKVYDGTNWIDAGSGGSGTGSFVRWIYTAIGGETSLSGSSGGVLLEYTPGLEEVFINGVLITRGADYSATNGSSITNLTALATGDVVTVTSMNPPQTVQLPGQVNLLRWSTQATSGQTVFSGVDSFGQQLQYSPGLEEVYVNGAFLRRGSDYTATDGSIITLSSPALENDEVSVLAWTPFEVGSQISANNVSFSQGDQGAVDRTVQAKLTEWVSIKDFGAVGNGLTDDTIKVQNALDAASGKSLVLEEGKNYAVTYIDIPDNVTLISNGSTFSKIDSSGLGILVRNGFKADKLSLTTVQGTSIVGIRIVGNDVQIDRLECVSSGVDSGTGVRIQTASGVGSLENVRINSAKVKNFLAGILIYGVGKSEFNDLEVQSYRTGVYLRDCYSCTFNGANVYDTSPAATGGPGQNGLLVESFTAKASTRDLRFTDWTVADAPEHGYRFGGQLTIENVWLSNCSSVRSGNAGAGATGGSGFKVLGATTVAGQRHKNFFFESCLVEDCSTTGDGIGNFSGFQLSVVDNVHVSNCSVVTKDNTYSCWDGLLIDSVTDLVVSNCIMRDCRRHAIRGLATDNTGGQFPGWNGLNKNIMINGGFYETTTNTMVMRLENPGGAPGTFDNVKLSGVTLSKGNTAVRFESGIAYTDCFFDITYVDPLDISGAPPIQGSNSIVFNFKGPFYGTYGSASADGSIFQNTNGGANSVLIRKNLSWVAL